MRPWWKDPLAVLMVAEHGIETGEFITAIELFRFFEKPHNYPELHEAWDRECERAYDEREERRAIL